jgi:hypothetical protein
MTKPKAKRLAVEKLGGIGGWPKRPGGVEMANAALVIAWADSKPRPASHSAFSSGPERQAAYWIEWAEARQREQIADACWERRGHFASDLAARAFAELVRCGTV